MGRLVESFRVAVDGQIGYIVEWESRLGGGCRVVYPMNVSLVAIRWHCGAFGSSSI